MLSKNSHFQEWRSGEICQKRPGFELQEIESPKILRYTQDLPDPKMTKVQFFQGFAAP